MRTAVLQTLPAGADHAFRLAARLGIAAEHIELHRFPDGELRVTVGDTTQTAIIYASLDQPNDKLIALLFTAEALRRNGAKRLVLVAPYLCYMRQDTAFHPGEAISQRAIGRLLAIHFDRVVTVDSHLHRTHDIGAVFPGIEAENLSAMPAIAAALRTSRVKPETIIAGPDAESHRWVTALAAELGLDATIANKIRRGDRDVALTFENASAIKGRPVLLVDDTVSSGGTLIAAARALMALGANGLDAIITHALFPPAIADALTQAGIRSIRSTTSVPHPSNAIALDDVLAAALWREIGATNLPEPSL
jgi:ribose-phosphate pyrophosphokinase